MDSMHYYGSNDKNTAWFKIRGAILNKFLPDKMTGRCELKNGPKKGGVAIRDPNL